MTKDLELDGLLNLAALKERTLIGDMANLAEISKEHEAIQQMVLNSSNIEFVD